MAFRIQLKKRQKRLKKLNLLFILLFLLSLNYIGKFIVNFVSGRSLYNFSLNLILGICFSVLVIVLLRIRTYKKSLLLSSFILSQGIIFYFLLTQPRLFDKLLLIGFYFSGILIFHSSGKKRESFFYMFILLVAIIFEISGILFFDRNFLYLNILRNFIIGTAGHTTGYLIFKS